MMRLRYLIPILLAGWLFGATAPSADADFRVRIESNGQGVVVTDQNLVFGGDASSVAGSLSVTTVDVGDFKVVVTAAETKPLIPTGADTALSRMNLTIGFTAKGTLAGGGILTVTVEDDTYTAGSDGSLTYTVENAKLTAGGGLASAKLQAWVNPDNLVPNLGAEQVVVGPLGAISGLPPAGSIPVFGGGPSSLDTSGSVGFGKDGPYSLFMQTVVTAQAGGTGSVDITTSVNGVTVVPAPAGAVLALSALPLLGFGWLRRRNSRRNDVVTS